MSQALSGTLKKTPLNARHRSLGARMVEFGGWDMPVEYSGIVDEHHGGPHPGRASSTSATWARSRSPAPTRSRRSSTSPATTPPGSPIGQTSTRPCTTPQGTFVDDVLTYKLADEHFMLVVNASNIVKDFHWITEQIAGDRRCGRREHELALRAHRAPGAGGARRPADADRRQPGDIKYYWFTTGEVAGVRVTISRTGYTGEDGFEVFVPPASAERVWDAILHAGKAAGVVPAGLGARDTLRLEAAMRLYGNDIDETTTVLEADLGWIDRLEEGVVHRPRRAAAAEGRQASRASSSASRCSTARSRGTATTSTSTDEKAGVVTSGTQTPYLKKTIGMAYLPSDRTAPGTEFEIDVRGRRVRAQVVPMPFYKRPPSPTTS